MTLSARVAARYLSAKEVLPYTDPKVQTLVKGIDRLYPKLDRSLSQVMAALSKINRDGSHWSLAEVDETIPPSLKLGNAAMRQQLQFAEDAAVLRGKDHKRPSWSQGKKSLELSEKSTKELDGTEVSIRDALKNFSRAYTDVGQAIEELMLEWDEGKTAAVESRVARRFLAMQHPSEEAKKDYLKEHPNADPSNHTVSEGSGSGASKGKDPKKAKEFAKKSEQAWGRTLKTRDTLNRLSKQVERLTSYRHSDPAKAKEVSKKMVSTLKDTLTNMELSLHHAESADNLSGGGGASALKKAKGHVKELKDKLESFEGKIDKDTHSLGTYAKDLAEDFSGAHKVTLDSMAESGLFG